MFGYLVTFVTSVYNHMPTYYTKYVSPTIGSFWQNQAKTIYSWNFWPKSLITQPVYKNSSAVAILIIAIKKLRKIIQAKYHRNPPTILSGTGERAWFTRALRFNQP